jgi:GT2 family glycosyltransferase
MQPVPSNLPPGHIGIISGDLARFPSVYASLLSLYVPENTSWTMAKGTGIADNRNAVVRGSKGGWLWFVDDDMAFKPRTLLSLLECDCDVVVPVVPNRKPPFQPLAYKRHEDGYRPLNWSEVPPRGLIEVDACTAGGLLIKRKVLDAIGDPWFREGQLRVDKLSEDMSFCAAAIANGFSVHLNCSVRVEHMTACAIGSSQDGPYVRVEGETIPCRL